MPEETTDAIQEDLQSSEQGSLQTTMDITPSHFQTDSTTSETSPTTATTTTAEITTSIATTTTAEALTTTTTTTKTTAETSTTTATTTTSETTARTTDSSIKSQQIVKPTESKSSLKSKINKQKDFKDERKEHFHEKTFSRYAKAGQDYEKIEGLEEVTESDDIHFNLDIDDEVWSNEFIYEPGPELFQDKDESEIKLEKGNFFKESIKLKMMLLYFRYSQIKT